MSTYELISLLIAGYAALLSSILAFRAITENRRILKIKFVYVLFYEKIELILENSGKKPLTISSIILGDSIYDTAPLNSMFQDEFSGFPIKLEPNVEFRITLSEIFYDYFHNDTLKIFVFDNDGNVYTKYKKYQLNPKKGGLERIF